jgi:hypothetical protein
LKFSGVFTGPFSRLPGMTGEEIIKYHVSFFMPFKKLMILTIIDLEVPEPDCCIFSYF